MTPPASKIPAHATRVFQGVIYDVYQWQQELFDGTTATFECLKRPNTAVVIPVSGNTVFYSVQEQPGKPPFLGLFGGRAEQGEDPLTAAQRELKEEAGLTSPRWQLLSIWSSPGKVEWNVYTYIAYDCQKTAAQHLDAGEKIEVKTATLEEFVHTIIPHPTFREMELKTLIHSAPNPQAAASLLQTLAAKE